MNFDKISGKWNRLSIKWKIFSVVMFFILIGMSTRSLILAVIAWGIILFYAVKAVFDLEML